MGEPGIDLNAIADYFNLKHYFNDYENRQKIQANNKDLKGALNQLIR